MKIGIIDSVRHSYVATPDIEVRAWSDIAEVILFRVAAADDLPAAVAECDGILSWHLVPLDASAITRLKRCRGIVRAAVGFDNIDLVAAAAQGIQVANVPDYGTEEVADHTLALSLSMLRRIPQSDRLVRRGCWDWREVGPLPRLRDFRVGLLGCGRIGTAVASRFKAFGSRVSFFDPYVPSGWEKALGISRCETLNELIESVDLLSVHAPLSSETRHLIGAAELAMMYGKFLVNTARGPIIDSLALADAAGRLAGIALDVFEDESQTPPSPLDAHDRLLWSPHVAFYSERALPELREKAAICLRSILTEGTHRNVIRPPVQRPHQAP